MMGVVACLVIIIIALDILPDAALGETACMNTCNRNDMQGKGNK